VLVEEVENPEIVVAEENFGAEPPTGSVKAVWSDKVSDL
jgi:hypothetical protein